MKHLVSALLLIAVVVIGLALAAPALSRLATAIVPLVIVAGVVAAVLRLVWAYTRRW